MGPSNVSPRQPPPMSDSPHRAPTPRAPSASSAGPGAAARGTPVFVPTIRIGFAGHMKYSETQLAAPLDRAFRLVEEAIAKCGIQEVRAAEDGIEVTTPIRNDAGYAVTIGLLTGYAPGADRSAVAAWMRYRAGKQRRPLHLLLPFIDHRQPDDHAWTDKPHGQHHVRLPIPGMIDEDAFTVLDGQPIRSRTTTHPHVEVGRWLSRWSDILLVAWDGEPVQKPGGTAEAVRLALSRRVPVVWFNPADATLTLRLLTADHFRRDITFAEIARALKSPKGCDQFARKATCKRVSQALTPALRIPPGNDVHEALEVFLTRPPRGWHVHWVGAIWKWILRLLAAPEATRKVSLPQVPAIISRELDRADHIATVSGRFQRGLQVLILALAVLTVVVGTLPAGVNALLIAGGHEHEAHEFKGLMVSIELVLLLAVVWLWTHRQIRGNHGRWADSRRLAERLRCLQATWPLGFDAAGEIAAPPANWIDWYADQVRRQAGPRPGVLRETTLMADAAALREDPYGIVRGQVDYNKLLAKRFHRLEGCLDRIEVVTLAILLAGLLAYAIRHWFGHALDMPEPGSIEGGILLVASAVIPAIGASCLAFGAKAEVAETVHRAEYLEKAFEHREDQMKRARHSSAAADGLRGAAELLLRDSETWHENVPRRQLSAF